MRFKVFIVTLLSFFVFIPFVSAQSENNSSNSSAKRDEAMTIVENKGKEMRLEISTLKKEKAKAYFDQMVEKIKTMFEKIQKLTDRIDARIVKIEASDTEDKIDVSKTKEDISLAKTKLGEIKPLIDGLTIEETLSSETPRVAFLPVREKIKLIKDELKEVHKLLVQTIGDLKGLRVGDIKK